MTLVPDPTIVDVAAVREVFGAKVERLRAVFEALKRDLPLYLQDLQRALQSGDRRATALAAHRIAGAAGTLGGVRVMTRARGLEEAAAADGALPDVDALESDVDELVTALDRWTASLLLP